MAVRLTSRSLLFFLLCSVLSAQAAVRLPTVLGSHMVLQRDRPVHIWGFADPAEAVTAAFRGETRTAAADATGRWSLYFQAAGAGGPFDLLVKGTNELNLNDILVGDVWLASGQSNMEFPLARADSGTQDVSAANHPQIRLFKTEHRVSEYPLEDVPSRSWVKCDPKTIANFSAVAYYFGSDLQERLAVPVGLIESDWGGTPADAWTSLPALSSDAALMPVFSEWARMMEDEPHTLALRERELDKWQKDVAQAKAEGKRPPDKPWAPNQDNCWMPGGLYNAMIAPFTPYAIRGVIWYQGESNASPERAGIYARLFQTMIRDWRKAWGEGDFPFLFVQIANFTAGHNSEWPEVREAQLETLSLANTGMAVTIDIGNPTDIHPKDKKDVGLRLALAARAVAYGEKLEFSGPLFRQATTEGGSLRVWFDHAGNMTSKSAKIGGFEIAGSDHKFQPAEARIEGSSVVVSNAEIPSPKFVRYGWSDNPECSLFNGQGLPASPFRSF